MWFGIFTFFIVYVFLALYIEMSVFDYNNCCIVVAVLVWQLQQTQKGFPKVWLLKKTNWWHHFSPNHNLWWHTQNHCWCSLLFGRSCFSSCDMLGKRWGWNCEVSLPGSNPLVPETRQKNATTVNNQETYSKIGHIIRKDENKMPQVWHHICGHLCEWDTGWATMSFRFLCSV